MKRFDRVPIMLCKKSLQRIQVRATEHTKHLFQTWFLFKGFRRLAWEFVKECGRPQQTLHVGYWSWNICTMFISITLNLSPNILTPSPELRASGSDREPLRSIYSPIYQQILWWKGSETYKLFHIEGHRHKIDMDSNLVFLSRFLYCVSGLMFCSPLRQDSEQSHGVSMTSVQTTEVNIGYPLDLANTHGFRFRKLPNTCLEKMFWDHVNTAWNKISKVNNFI